MGKKKLYAVYFIEKQEKKIYYEWGECQKALKGKDNIFKGFISEKEAQEWLESITEKKIKQHHDRLKQTEKKKKEKKDCKKYEVYLEQKYSDILDNFLNLHKITISEYVREIIEIELT